MSFQTLLRPNVLDVIMFIVSWHPFRQNHPRLLASGIYVDTRRTKVRLIERANPDIAQIGSIRPRRSSVVAPQRDAAFGAAGNELALAALGRRVDKVGFGVKISDVIILDHSIETESRACFALAPAAVTAVHHQGLGLHAEAYVLAVAAAFEREWIFSLTRGLSGAAYREYMIVSNLQLRHVASWL